MSRNGQLDLVLVHPGTRMQVYQSLGSKLAAIEPPVWASLLATFVRKHGFSVQVVDAEADNLTPKETAMRIEDMDPKLAVIVVYGHQPSASTQNMTVSGLICGALKEHNPNRKLALVGGHVAALPERTLREESAEFVCTGEGPHTVVDLLQAVNSISPDYSKVRGICYWKDGVVTSTPAAPLVKNLDDEIPELAWDLLPMDKYRAHNWHCFGALQREPYASFYTTFGCPFHCSFCCIQAPFKTGEKEAGWKDSVNSYRFWSAQAVVAQIDKLVNQYGIDAASDRVRDDVDKGFDQEEIFRTLEKVRGTDINVIANYIFGLREEDLDSMEATLNLALELNCEFANFYSAMAYPGSQLYNLAIREGWPLPDKWSGYSQHAVDTLPLPTKYLSGTEVLRFRDEAFQVYYSSRRYLDVIKRKFGADTENAVKEMAAHKLKRNILSTDGCTA